MIPLDSYPKCMQLPIENDGRIWTGHAVFTYGNEIASGTVKVYLDCKRSPSVRFELTTNVGFAWPHLLLAVGDATLSTSGPLGQLSCTLSGREYASSTDGTSICGVVVNRHPVSFSDAKFVRAEFIVVNGPHIDGQTIADESSAYCGRIEHKLAGKKFVLDRLADRSTNSESQFRFTHIARCEFDSPTDGALVEVLATDLFRVLSLVNCRWVGVVGPWLYDDQGTCVRIVPFATKTAYLARTVSWHHRTDCVGFLEVFDCMVRAFQDHDRMDGLRTAFHWLIEAEQCAGGVEGSLILQQCALECLSWLEVVRTRELESKSKFDARTAASKITLLLSLFNINDSIPSKVPLIQSYATHHGKCNMIEVLTHVRNTLVHAEPAKVEKLLTRADGNDERSDLWFQVGGLLQQAFLAAIGYGGNFVNRSVAADYAIKALQQVPWAKSSKT